MNPVMKASIFYVFGNGLGQGLILLGTVLFTRLMSKEDYGVYSTYYSLVSILTTVVGANLFVGLNNGYVDYADRIRNFRASILLLSSVVFGMLSGVVLIGSIVLGGDTPIYLIVFALLHAYAFFVVNYYCNSANMENRYKAKTLFMILPNLCQVSFSVIVLLMLQGTFELQGRVIASTLGVTVCAVYAYIYIIRGEKNLINKEYWKYALDISVPSIFSSISYMVMQQSDKVMITEFYGASETAVYSLVYYIGYILYAVLQATNGVWQSWLYRALDSDRLENAKKAQKWYLFLLAMMAFGLYMIAPEIVKILAPESYWNFNYVAPFVVSSCLMAMYSFYTTIGTFYKKTGKVSMCVAIAAVVNIVLNYLLIPIFGGIAAAYTSAAAYVVLFILSRNLVQKIRKGIFLGKYFALFLTAVVLGAALFLFIYPYVIVRYAAFIFLLILCLIYAYKNKDEILSLIK